MKTTAAGVLCPSCAEYVPLGTFENKTAYAVFTPGPFVIVTDFWDPVFATCPGCGCGTHLVMKRTGMYSYVDRGASFTVMAVAEDVVAGGLEAAVRLYPGGPWKPRNS
jgi:hypothetical protein